jgi:hypothetical protein
MDLLSAGTVFSTFDRGYMPRLHGNEWHRDSEPVSRLDFCGLGTGAGLGSVWEDIMTATFAML